MGRGFCWPDGVNEGKQPLRARLHKTFYEMGRTHPVASQIIKRRSEGFIGVCTQLVWVARGDTDGPGQRIPGGVFYVSSITRYHTSPDIQGTSSVRRAGGTDGANHEVGAAKVSMRWGGAAMG